MCAGASGPEKMSRITTSKRRSGREIRKRIPGIADRPSAQFLQVTGDVEEKSSSSRSSSTAYWGAPDGSPGCIGPASAPRRKVQRVDGPARRGGQVHDVGDPAEVLIEYFARLGEVYVGLLRAADAQHEGSFGKSIRFYGRCCPMVRRNRGPCCGRGASSKPVAERREPRGGLFKDLGLFAEGESEQAAGPSAPSGWQKTGTGIAATPTRPGSLRARSTESEIPRGAVSTFTK